ncbi:MAG: prepilin-type N-terminal cleavage/methylation domain-containing protein [Halioglobus sp.]
MISPAPSGCARPSGFTLVEVVVALGIMSLIMLATISALRTFGNTQVSLDRLTGRIDDVRTVSSFLRDMLQSTVPYVEGSSSGGLSLGGGTGGAETSYFRGTATSLEWKAPVQFGEGYGGMHLLQVREAEGSMVLRWQQPPGSMRMGDPVSWGGTDSRVLVAQLESLEIAYKAEFDSEWQTEWQNDESPALVKLNLKVAGRYWPELILPVHR